MFYVSKVIERKYFKIRQFRYKEMMYELSTAVVLLHI